MADDNGVFKYEGSPSNNLHYDNLQCTTTTAHLKEGKWFVKRRSGRKYVDEEVNPSKVFILTRTYKRHVVEKDFCNTICRIKNAASGKYQKYCLVINEWTGPQKSTLTMKCHGNAKTDNAKATPFMRTERNVLKEMNAGIKNGGRIQEVYHSAIESSGGPLKCTSQSKQPRNPKQVKNIYLTLNLEPKGR